MMRSTDTNSWQPTSWQARKAQQQPVYADAVALERAVADLSRLPPIVVSWEIENLRTRLAAAAFRPAPAVPEPAELPS